MKHLAKLRITAVVAAGLALGPLLACGQDQQPPAESQVESKPKPAGQALPPVDQDPNADQDATPLRPDTQPLTGVQNPTLGSPQVLHSYWVPGVEYLTLGASTALNQIGVGGWNSTNYIVGSMSLLQTWSDAQLSVNYSGGGHFSSDSSQGNGSVHELELVQTLEWQRWRFELLDQFSYLPQAAFGFGTGTSLAIPGIGGNLGSALTGLQTSYQPSQSIFTSIGPRYSNSFTPQAVYAISSRASFNFAGSYGILRFVEAGNIDSNDFIFNAGYNYSLDSKDTIGVLYRFTAYRYLGLPQALNDHILEAAYGRRITGHLNLQLFVGPELTTFREPFEGVTRHIAPAVGAALRYAWRSNNVTADYRHGISNGSGIEIGSNVYQVQTGVGRLLSRHWSGNVNFGYVRNVGLGNSVPSTTSQTFNSYYIGGALSRPIGRDSDVTVAYSAYIQNSNQAVCPAYTCNRSYIQHLITLGFSWHATPFVLR
jgi:hypothetical protein